MPHGTSVTFLSWRKQEGYCMTTKFDGTMSSFLDLLLALVLLETIPASFLFCL
jgi:hypothetical protein